MLPKSKSAALGEVKSGAWTLKRKNSRHGIAPGRNQLTGADVQKYLKHGNEPSPLMPRRTPDGIISSRLMRSGNHPRFTRFCSSTSFSSTDRCDRHGTSERLIHAGSPEDAMRRSPSRLGGRKPSQLASSPGKELILSQSKDLESLQSTHGFYQSFVRVIIEPFNLKLEIHQLCQLAQFCRKVSRHADLAHP